MGEGWVFTVAIKIVNQTNLRLEHKGRKLELYLVYIFQNMFLIITKFW